MLSSIQAEQQRTDNLVIKNSLFFRYQKSDTDYQNVNLSRFTALSSRISFNKKLNYELNCEASEITLHALLNDTSNNGTEPDKESHHVTKLTCVLCVTEGSIV